MLNRTRFMTTALIVLAISGTVWAQNSALPLQPGEDASAATAQLVEIIKSDASDQDKAIAYKRLALIGTKEAAPTLAVMLSDEKFAHYARYALEVLPDASADKALRGAMSTLQGELLVGVINSIGQRGDVKAVDGLCELVSNADPQIAAAATAALGRIGSDKAVETLIKAVQNAPEDLQEAFGDACLACADSLLDQNKKEAAIDVYAITRGAKVPKHIKIAATYGELLASGTDDTALLVEQLGADDLAFFRIALQAARLLPGTEVTGLLLSQLKSLPEERQAVVILALGDREDAAATPKVIELAKSGSPALRVAALRALKKLGDAKIASMLLDAATDENEDIASAAQDVLAELEGDTVDDAVLKLLKQSDSAAQCVAIDLVGRRRIAAALPTLFDAANASDKEISQAAVLALGTTVGLSDIPKLLDRAVNSASDEDKAAAQAAVFAACMRMTDVEQCAQVLIDFAADEPNSTKVYVFERLVEVGGNAALKTVAAAARSTDDEIQDAGTRILGEWMSTDAAPELLKLAKTLTNNKYKVRAMRGYIRIPRQLNMMPEERLAMCVAAMAAAERVDEKKLVVEIFWRNPSLETLAMAVDLLGDAELKTPAAAAAIKIGNLLVVKEPVAVTEAMQAVLASGVGKGSVANAEAVLAQVGK